MPYHIENLLTIERICQQFEGICQQFEGIC